MAKGSGKIGVYICSGCGIGESLDVPALEASVKNKPGVHKCQGMPMLCTAESRLRINDEIGRENLDALVLAGCSPRHTSRELGFNDIYTERVNLREGVAWVMEPGNEDTQAAAEDYMLMGVAKTKFSAMPVPYSQEETSENILVIGGGITGYRCTQIDG